MTWMNLWQTPAKSTTAALFFCAVGSTGLSFAAEKRELPEGFPLWHPSASVRQSLGYKDNVTLSSSDSQESAFEVTGVEAMLFRLPWNNWQVSLMAMGSDTRYFDRSLDVDAEQNAVVSGEFAWFMGKGWKSVSTLQYVFFDEVIDVSATYGTSVPQQVFGHGLTFKQGMRKDVGPWWAALDLAGSRYFLREPLDGYWQPGPQLTLGRYYGHGSEVSLAYQVSPFVYDTREQADPTGASIPGTELRYLLQTAELSWQHFWDEPRRWRHTARLSFESNEDNGSGYYDYAQYRISEQVRYRAGGWELSAQVSLAYYDFPNQAVRAADSSPRHRTDFRATLRGEKSLAKHWRAHLACEREQSFSNSDVEPYEANTVSGGVEFEF